MFGDLEAREDLKQLIQLLNKALDTGDEDAAVKYAELLASKKVKCTVKVNTASQTRDGKNFCIKVHIEDKDNSGGIISLSVNPSDTILDLKTKMFHEHNFPTGIQHWVIGRALPRDEETLRRYNIVDGTVIYLYLSHVAADSAKTTHVDERLALTIMEKENSTIKAERSPKAQSSHSPNLPPPGTTPEAHALNQTMGQMSLNQSGGQGQNIDQRSKSAGVNDDQVEPLSDPETRPGMIEGAGPEVVTVGELGQIHFVQNKKRVGWTCPACTFVNLPSRPGCEICSTTRPLDYKVPESYVMTEEEKRRLQQEQESEQQTKTYEDQRREKQLVKRHENFQRLLAVEEQHLIPNNEAFDCPICFDTISPGEGVVLRECLHSFCRDCLQAAVQYNEEAVVRCPYMDAETVCNAPLQQREIKELVPVDMFDKYLQRSLSTAESQEMNSFHCKTADCPGWCIYEDMVNFFQCPVCKHENCLTCKAIHTGLDCKQYQVDLVLRSKNDEAARNTQQMLENLVESGDAMYCPGCKVIVQKKDGCDWVRCSICKLEICWVTKGPRWGPLGTGDISGGCGCRVGGRRCHPHCNNCH